MRRFDYRLWTSDLTSLEFIHMFSGIVEEMGEVREPAYGKQLVIKATKVLEGTKPGDSISVNGVCLTVISLDKSSFSVEVMPETLRRSNLGHLKASDLVNLERALALNTRIGGHLVQGHIDGTGKVLSYSPEDGAIITTYQAPLEVIKYLVSRAFIAVDGASLTVIDCSKDAFSVSLVGFTREHTNLAKRHTGDLVNLEVDITAKYIEKLMGSKQSNINMELLREKGFIP